MIILYRLVLSGLLTVITSIVLNVAKGNAFNTLTFEPTTMLILFISLALTALISPLLKQVTISLPFKNTSPREQGQVKWFNISKGYGFVTRESGEDVFVHFRSIRGRGRRALREGQCVKFTVVDGDKGPQAEDVDPLVG